MAPQTAVVIWHHMKFPYLTLLALLAPLVYSTPINAAEAGVSTAYERIVTQRAEKIVAPLGLSDPAEAARVRKLVADFYRDLNAIQGSRDAAIKEAKANVAADKSERDAAIKSAREKADAARQTLHDAFVRHLNAELTPGQVDRVKDGLTYGVAPLTFRVYQEMLPNLTAAQKEQIHAWLLEAREHAMDGFTAQEKHAWFGKYKGRINNFLAQAGYNMKAAEKNLHAHR